MRNNVFWLMTAAALFPLLSQATTRASGIESRPNIVLIMGDDIGFADLGCFGSEIDTPNLDTLARGGVRFTQAYNMAKCEPTRSAMLTGTFWSNQIAQSLGTLLGKAGYTTINCGKEHFHAWVPQRCRAMNSFHRSFTHYGGAGSFFRKNAIKFHLDRERIAIDDMQLSGPYYKTRAITDYAIKFLKETNSKKKPFFLYVAYEAAHSPIHPLKEDFEKYQGRYLKGWDLVREQRFAKQKELNVLEPGTKLSPPHGLHYSRGNPYVPWNEVAESERKRFDAQMAGFAGMVHCMDRNIGRIVDTIREMGQLEDTLIIYLSDNGSCPFTNGRGKPASQTNAKKENNSYIKVMDDGLGFHLPNLDAKWANVGNTPYRHFKQAGHEGGARTHLIAHWPKVISQGTIHRSPVHVVDFMPTFLELAKAEYPPKVDGAIPPKLDGISLLPAFEGKPTDSKRFLITGHTDDQRKIRFGDWAIVKLKGSSFWELYNLKEDPSELNDLAAEMPEKVSSLVTLYEDWKTDRKVGGFNTKADTTIDK
jgi:arylsulfatase